MSFWHFILLLYYVFLFSTEHIQVVFWLWNLFLQIKLAIVAVYWHETLTNLSLKKGGWGNHLIEKKGPAVIRTLFFRIVKFSFLVSFQRLDAHNKLTNDAWQRLKIIFFILVYLGPHGLVLLNWQKLMVWEKQVLVDFFKILWIRYSVVERKKNVLGFINSLAF